MPTRPTTTTYAVLGLLALRPWTPYELAQQVERSLELLWPSSVRTIYNEPKRLVELGWASSRERPGQPRSATEYKITASGRRALATWLASPPEEPPLAFEGLLRVMYADQGSADQLVRALEESARQWRQRVVGTLPQAHEYLGDGGPFPERIHLIALVAQFVDAYATLVEDFARDVAREASSWPATAGVGLTPGAETVLRDLLARREEVAPTEGG